MTLWASEYGSDIRIHSNHGNTVTITDPEYGRSTRVEVVIQDSLEQMKSLWGSLGALIEKQEKKLEEGKQSDNG